jgi:hypothetical protein
MVAKFFEQNLQLMYEFFQNNVTKDLVMKISKRQDTFKAGEQGGPFFVVEEAMWFKLHEANQPEKSFG